MKRVLFLCGRNKLRSPTAEQVFCQRNDIEVDSAGLDADSDTPLAAEQVAWADLIFVMEKTHRSKLAKRFRAELKAKVICLDIPDHYAFMDPELVKLLQERVTRHLR